MEQRLPMDQILWLSHLHLEWLSRASVDSLEQWKTSLKLAQK
jgi:hypothetical protein